MIIQDRFIDRFSQNGSNARRDLPDYIWIAPYKLSTQTNKSSIAPSWTGFRIVFEWAIIQIVTIGCVISRQQYPPPSNAEGFYTCSAPVEKS